MKRFVFLLTVLLTACSSGPDYKGADLIEAARVNTQLGIDYMRKGQNDLAEEKLKRATSQDPDYAMAHATLGFLYQRMGEGSKAEKAYRKALQIDPANSSVRNNFGVFLCGQGKMAEAEKYFLEAAYDKRYSTPEAAWANAGVCVYKEDIEKAERYFRSSLEANPQFPDALSQMARLTYLKKDYWRARAFLQRYELTGAATPETVYLGVLNERALGDANAAMAYERRLRLEFPNSEEAANLSKSK